MVKGRRTNIAVRQPEVRAVQDVENLGAELELLRFCHPEILKRSEVPIGVSRTDIHVAAFRAELPRVGYRIKSLVSTGVEPGAYCTRPVIGIADEIGSLRGEAGDLRRAALCRDVVRVEDRKR